MWQFRRATRRRFPVFRGCPVQRKQRRPRTMSTNAGFPAWPTETGSHVGIPVSVDIVQCRRGFRWLGTPKTWKPSLRVPVYLSQNLKHFCFRFQSSTFYFRLPVVLIKYFCFRLQSAMFYFQCRLSLDWAYPKTWKSSSELLTYVLQSLGYFCFRFRLAMLDFWCRSISAEVIFSITVSVDKGNLGMSFKNFVHITHRH